MTLKKNQSQPMLTFNTRDRDHEVRNYRAKGKPKKQRSKILNKKILMHEIREKNLKRKQQKPKLTL
jgi:hypothetical protein